MTEFAQECSLQRNERIWRGGGAAADGCHSNGDRPELKSVWSATESSSPNVEGTEVGRDKLAICFSFRQGRDRAKWKQAEVMKPKVTEQRQ